MTDTATDTDTTEYRLTDDVDRVVRADLVLEGEETVELNPDEAAAHDDVLEPVDDANESSSDDQDQEADA